MQHDPVWDIRELGAVLWRWRRFLLRSVGIVTAASVVLALLLPSWYRASSALLPPQEEMAGFSVSTMLRGLTIPGVKIPTQASPGEVFVAILISRTLLTELVQEFDLRRIYKKKSVEETVNELRRHVSAQISEDGLVVVSVEDRDRDRAARMTNRMIELLDRFNRQTRSSRGKRARLFIERRLEDTKRDLAVAEDSLRRYQEKHKSLLLPSEDAGAATLAAKLLAERIDLEMRAGLASSIASESSPELQRLRQRQLELDRQIQRLPDLGMGTARLYRDVKVQEQVFALLMAQLEESKIEEAKDIATVEILDRAIPPERKARPRRSVVVMLGFAGSLMLGLGYVLAVEYLRRVQRAA
jgi:uncharacterized protein involved in exopolysaccharide biosynthesis